MTYYNLTHLWESNSTLEVITAVNTDLTGQWFALFIVISLFIIILTNLSRLPFQSSFLFSTFFINIIAGLLWVSGLLPIYVFVVSLLLVFIAVILFFLTGGGK